MKLDHWFVRYFANRKTSEQAQAKSLSTLASQRCVMTNVAQEDPPVCLNEARVLYIVFTVTVCKQRQNVFELYRWHCAADAPAGAPAVGRHQGVNVFLLVRKLLWATAFWSIRRGHRVDVAPQIQPDRVWLIDFHVQIFVHLFYSRLLSVTAWLSREGKIICVLSVFC